MKNLRALPILILGLVALGLGAWLSGRLPTLSTAPSLVVYCAHDAEYSEPLLKEFERRSGIPVHIRFDTEATKSLGLINLLIKEKSQPRCDVFWNNELLGMIDLQDQGLLQPYQGPSQKRIPDEFKDSQGNWTGFAARLRVHILHESQHEKKISQEVETSGAPGIRFPEFRVSSFWENDLSQVAIAKPLYGTTLAHYTVLADLWGLDKLRNWHAEQIKRGLQIVNGNGTVKNLVAQGALQTGWTDTDDFFSAKDAGLPVRMLPVYVEGQRTICIPNTVGIIRDTRHLPEAQKLVDFLTSAETELALARSTARQIPLGHVDEVQLSDEVRQLIVWAKQGYDLRNLLPMRRKVIDWLSTLYLNTTTKTP